MMTSSVQDANTVQFAQQWVRALGRTSFVPLPLAEREAILLGFSRRFVTALTAAPFDAEQAFEIGAELVESEFAKPEILGCSISVIQSSLAATVTDHVADLNERVAGLMEAFATGFGVAMNDRCLDGQESVRVAALTAQARAEQALRDSETKFRYFATRDDLTSLPNRTRFIERLREAGENANANTRLAVCCIDLDGFGRINDGLGHIAGDRVLATVAERLLGLETASSTAGCELFRLDSDEFAVLISDIRYTEQASKAADVALNLLSEPIHVNDNEIPVSASAGIVETNANNVDAGELLRSAEIALHWAKADGKNCSRLFEPKRSESDTARYRLSAAMPGALRRGEFTVAFQPLVGLGDGRLTGVEALARWEHPEHGELPASRFIGLAEDTGLIVAMDDYVLQAACSQAAQWQSLTSDMPYVSVNLSPRQLRRTGLAGYVAQVLDDTGLAPDRLQLEITEHAVIGTDEESVAALRTLANLGVRISIDDFGTGYSNLACLSVLPLHSLKLDAAFVQNRSITTSYNGQDFIATIVRLGHTLGLEVIAEGIESIKQARRLREAGCDVGQGYLFGRPAVAVGIAELIDAGRASLLGPATRPHYAA